LQSTTIERGVKAINFKWSRLKTVDDARNARAFSNTFSLTALSLNGGFHDQIAV
jgi:hypothetical protein